MNNAFEEYHIRGRFADGNAFNEEHIKEAVEHASHNFYIAHHAMLKYGCGEGADFYVYVKTPQPVGKDGYPLRGVSLYLLKKYPDIYEPRKKCTRLISWERL